MNYELSVNGQAWAKAGRTVEELPFQAQCGMYGSVAGILVILGALAATFYVALYPVKGYIADDGPQTDDTTLTAYYFFSVYLAFPVVFASFLGYWLYLIVFFPEGGWHLLPIEDIDLMTGMADIPPLEELQKMREEHASLPWYTKLFREIF